MTPFSVTIESVMNSTAAAPNYSIWVTNDVPGGVVTASSSSNAAFFNTSTSAFNSSVTWYSSLSLTNSSNAFLSITTPFRYLTVVASAGSTNQQILSTILQVGMYWPAI